MKRKLFGGLLFTAMLCFIMCTVVMAEDVPMTEEEITYVEESFSVETEAEEELIVAEEEEEFLEADGLVEDEEILEAAEDFSFNTAIPDSTFQTFLKERGWTTLDRISMVSELNFAGMGIEDLTGIKYFTNLQTLNCSRTKITKLDVSGLTKLEALDCYESYLSSLNVSDCTALTYLDCHANAINSLNISGCKNLTNLHLYYNNLKILDLSNCPKLAFLECDGNQLTSVDLSLCPILKDLVEHTPESEVDGYLLYEKTVSDSRVSYFTVDPGVNIITVHTHTWDSGKVTKEATTTSTGIRTYTCTVCGDTMTEIIDMIMPTILPQEVAEQITISKKPTIKNPSATKNKITVSWKHFKQTKKTKKVWKKIKKVQIQCATDKAFTNIIKTSMVGKKKTKATIKGLSKKTTYYVRVRYFDGTGYSAWSKVKKVKTK